MLQAPVIVIAVVACQVLAADEPGLYGPCTGEQPEVRSAYDDVPRRAWTEEPFAVVRSSLSPAWLVRSVGRGLEFFADMPEGPAFVLMPVGGGTATIEAGGRLDGSAMAEPWLLASFAGAGGWERFDAPYLIVLQHRPAGIVFDAGGLRLDFPAEAGYVACLPLYGYLKLPQQAQDFRREHGLPPLGIQSWTWRGAGPPDDVIERCRWWSRVLRAYPLNLRETFSIDRSRETVTMRQDVEWLETEDDWGTEPLRLHPLPPTLGLVYLDPGFPIEYSHPIHDPHYFTPYGPYLGALETDRLEMEYHVLQYVHNREDYGFPDCGTPGALTALEVLLPGLAGERREEAGRLVEELKRITSPSGPPPAFVPLPTRELVERLRDLLREAGSAAAAQELDGQLDDPTNRIAWTCLSRLRAAMAQKFRDPGAYAYDHGGLNNYVWSVMGDIWYAKALPYVGAELCATASASLRHYFEGVVLDESTYDAHEHKLIVHGPGIGSWGGWDDAGKIATNILQTIWAYAHYTGDWDLVRERWDLVRKLFITPEEMCWPTVGRVAIAEMGDEAPPCAAMARLAWRVGDVDAYRFAAYCHARELVHDYVKSLGAGYFVANQPLNHWEPMTEPVFLTNLWGDTAGWRIDGPDFPLKTGERQSKNRWVRFQCEDTARFYRDTPVLAAAVAAELNDPVTGRGRFEGHLRRDDSHILPSFVRVRSLILDEPAEALAALTPPEEVQGYGSMLIAPMMAYIRAAAPVRTVRLIPASGGPSPFLPGIERRAGRTGHPTLVQSNDWKAHWPTPRWFYWENGFGAIRPAEGDETWKRESQWIGQATQVAWYERPGP